MLRHRSVVLTEGWFNAVMVQMLMEESVVAGRRRRVSVWTGRTHKPKQEQGNVILVSG